MTDKTRSAKSADALDLPHDAMRELLVVKPMPSAPAGTNANRIRAAESIRQLRAVLNEINPGREYAIDGFGDHCRLMDGVTPLFDVPVRWDELKEWAANNIA
jgi:hypothetical protein